MSADKHKLRDRAMRLFSWYDIDKTKPHNIVINRHGHHQFHSASDWPELQYLIDNKYVVRTRQNSWFHCGCTVFKATQKWVNLELRRLKN